MMKFYDLRKRLCEERDVSGLSDLHCSGPGDNDSVQITAFTRRIDPPPPALTASPFTRNTTGPLKLVMPKHGFESLVTTNAMKSTAHSCDSSPTSDFDSDSDSGIYTYQTMTVHTTNQDFTTTLQ